MIGKQISHFRILSKVGEGGMGVVYRAEDRDLGRIVALKVLPPHLVGDQDRRARFVAEARTAASVTHPNIGTIHEIGEGDGHIFIAMELVEGESLRSRIRKGLSVKEALQLAAEIAAGLAAAHRARIAHRDLKPDNIVIAKDGHVKILDFGLARLLEGPLSQQRPSRADTPATQDGGAPEAEVADLHRAVTIPVGDQKVLGTPAYMSPEQARGLDLDYRTDIFSFGCTLYEMLTGRPPFQGPSTTSVIHEIINRDPIPATVLNPETPSSVQWILDKCLEKDPNRRYQDTRDLVVDLEHLYPDTGAVTRSGENDSWRTSGPSAAGRRTRQRRMAVFALVLVAILAAAAYRFWRGSSFGAPAAQANSLAVFSFTNLKDPSDPERLGKILQELLITDLSGLEPLKVYSSQRLADIERQVGQQEGEATDLQSTVARQAGAQRMLTGSLSQRGDAWVLTAQLTDVATGQVLGSKRLDGGDIYAMVDELTDQLQKDFTLRPPADVAGRSIKEKTSTSMEAWRHYLGGVDHLNANQFSEAVEELSTAVRVDPRFGQAYYQLGLATWWRYSDIGAGRDHLLHFLDKELYASEQEKQIAEAMLLVVDAKFGEALPRFQALARAHPDDKYIWYGLGEAQFHFPGESRQSESLASFERAAALDPDFLLPYWHIFAVLWGEERVDEALQRAEGLIAKDPDNPLWHRYRAASVVYRGDPQQGRAALAQAEEFNTTSEDRRDLYKIVAQSWGNLGYANLAEESLEKALEADPGHDDPQLIRGLSEYLKAQRKLDEYEQRTRALLAAAPENDLYQANLIDVTMEKHQFADAAKLAREFAGAEPANPRWYWYWAAATILSGQEANLADVLARAQQHNHSGDDLRNLYAAVASAYAACGYQNLSIDYFRRAIAAEAEPAAYLLQSVGYRELRRGHLEVAENWFREAAEVSPKNPQPLLLLALLEVERGEIERARTRLAEAEKLQPASRLQPFMGASLGIFTGDDETFAKLLTSETDSLTAEFQKWRVLYGEPGHFPLGLAWAYLLAGRNAEAEASFSAGTTLDFAQRDPVVYKGLGLTYLNQGDYGRAEAAFTSGLQVGVDKGAMLRGIGIARLLQGDAKGAEAAARRALPEDHPHVDSARLLGFALAEQDRHREALVVAEQAVAMDSSRTSFELLAWVLIDGELDLKRGAEVAKHAMTLPTSFLDVEKALPHRACAHHSLGLAYLKQGKPQLAAQQLEKAAALQPNRDCIHDDLMRATSVPSGT